MFVMKAARAILPGPSPFEANSSPLEISLLSNWFWGGCYQPGDGQAKQCSVSPPNGQRNRLCQEP